MDKKQANKIAPEEISAFRYGIIAGLCNDSYKCKGFTKEQFFKELASYTYITPFGTIKRFKVPTLKKWYQAYKKYGEKGLRPHERNDKYISKTIDEKAAEYIRKRKEKFPKIPARQLFDELVAEGIITKVDTSISSITRFLQSNELNKSKLIPNVRLAFEMEYANQCWQSDTSYGPILVINGQKRQTYLIVVLDDASRIVPYGEFFFEDNAINVQKVLKMGIAKKGIPDRIYLDNGTPYKNKQMPIICAMLGIELLHTKPYTPESKGKVERLFSTFKNTWLRNIDWKTIISLEELNTMFNEYLETVYHQNIHSSLKQRPIDRYMQDIDKIRFIDDPDKLNNAFLHTQTKTIRKGNSTINLNKLVFEVPYNYINNDKITVKYDPIDTSKAYVYDSKEDKITPLKQVDKIANSKINRNAISFAKYGGEHNV